MIISILMLAMTIVINTIDAKRILCFGDSITANGEWVAEVGTHEYIETINAGRSGRKAAQAKKELAGYLEKYADLDKIIMFLGVNDLPARDNRPGDEKIAACVTNMSAAIDLALTRFKPKDIILVAPCNVISDSMNSVNREKGYHITPPLLAKMEKQYKILAKEKGISFLSLLNVVSKENYKDGLHPNKDGDVEIAKAISEFLLTQSDVVISCSFKPYGGKYYKKDGANYVAIWVMDEAGTNIIRTLKIVGKTWEMKYYRKLFKGAKVPPHQEVPDAITQATRRHMNDEKVVWDLRDKRGQKVPMGTYRIYFELSEFDYTGALSFVTIKIDGKSKMVTQITNVDKPGSIHNVRVKYRASALAGDDGN
jgi:lysophospholipase L1-like esterase